MQGCLTITSRNEALTNRRNVGGYEYEFDEAADGYVPQTDHRTLLLLVPAIGVEWKFE